MTFFPISSPQHSNFVDSEGDTCFVDSEGDTCFVDSNNNIYFRDTVGYIYYKSEDGTYYDSTGEVCYKNLNGRIYFLSESNSQFYKIQSPEHLEHNDQTYYIDSCGYFYTLIDGQPTYVENSSSEQMKFIPDCLKTKRADSALPPYLSDHSPTFARVILPGSHVLNYGYWNVLAPCKIHGYFKNDKKSDKKINNPWGITSESNYLERLNETILKIISIIDNHENLGAFFLQEATYLNTDFFLKQLKERNWKLLLKNNVSILYKEKILKHIENISLGDIISEETQKNIMNFYNWRAPIKNRLLISSFCLLLKDRPVCKIHLSSFHLELAHQRISNPIQIKSLFEAIIRGVGTVTIFAGDTNQALRHPPSYFLGDPIKKISITSTLVRKPFSIVGTPISMNLSFEETALSYFIEKGLGQGVAIFNQPNTYILNPSQIFIERPSQSTNSFDENTSDIEFKKSLLTIASKNLFHEMERILFGEKVKPFYIGNLNLNDFKNLQVELTLLDPKNFPFELYDEINKLIRIYVYDHQQLLIFISRAKDLIGHELIYTKKLTKKSQLLTTLFFPFEVFEQFCKKLEISDEKIQEFIYLSKDIYNTQENL